MNAAPLATFAILCAAPSIAVTAQLDDRNADHQVMLDKLQITSLRHGPAGMMNADGSAPPDYANYDESKAAAT